MEQRFLIPPPPNPRWLPCRQPTCTRVFAMNQYPDAPEGSPCPEDGCALPCTSADPRERAAAEERAVRGREEVRAVLAGPSPWRARA